MSSKKLFTRLQTLCGQVLPIYLFSFPNTLSCLFHSNHSEHLLVFNYPGSSSSGLSLAVFPTSKTSRSPSHISVESSAFRPQFKVFLKKHFPVSMTETIFPIPESLCTIPWYVLFCGHFTFLSHFFVFFFF